MIKNLSHQIDCGYSEGMLGFLQQPQHRTPPAQPQEQLQLPFLQVHLLVKLNSYQRHPEHPQDMDTAGHTDRAQAATALTYRIHRIHKPFSSRSGRSKMSLVQGYTQYSLGSQAHMHLHGSLEYWHGPSVCPIAPVRPQSLFLTVKGLLLARWSSLVLTADTQTHTPLSGTPCPQVPQIPVWTLHPPGTPDQTQTQTQKIESEIVKERFHKKKKKQTVMIRCRPQSE